MSIRHRNALSAFSALILVLMLVAVPARAHAEGVPHLAGPTAGHRVAPDLNPATVGLCNAGLGDVSLIHTTATGLGRVDLRCGDTQSGYVHIRSTWGTSWRKATAGVPGRHLWDDFAPYATVRALTHPAAGYPRRSAHTWCYSSSLRVATASGRTIRELNPTVLVDTKSKNIVTAAPTSRPNCSIR